MVKWALEGRRKAAKAPPSPCAEDQRGGASTSAPTNASPSATAKSSHDQRAIPPSLVKSETAASDPSSLTTAAELDRLHFQSSAALAKSSETDVDRALRRIHAEEMASSLRDDKLLSLTGADAPQIHRRSSHQTQGGKANNNNKMAVHDGVVVDDENQVSQLPLTQENMQKLELDNEPAVVSLRNKQRHRDEDSSLAMEPPSRSESVRDQSVRPSLQDARAFESDRTVTSSSKYYR